MHEIAVLRLRNSQVEASPRAAAGARALVRGIEAQTKASVAYLKQMLLARLVVWLCAWKSARKDIAETG